MQHGTYSRMVLQLFPWSLLTLALERIHYIFPGEYVQTELCSTVVSSLGF